MTDRCFICGEDNPNVLQTHHIVPSRHGGTDDSENLVRLCANCHQALERIYNARFYQELGLEDGGDNDRSGKEHDRGIPNNLAYKFANRYLRYSYRSVVVKEQAQIAFNSWVRQQGYPEWDFDDRGVQSQFGSQVRDAVDGELKNTKRDGEVAYLHLELTEVGWQFVKEENYSQTIEVDDD